MIVSVVNSQNLISYESFVFSFFVFINMLFKNSLYNVRNIFSNHCKVEQFLDHTSLIHSSSSSFFFFFFVNQQKKVVYDRISESDCILLWPVHGGYFLKNIFGIKFLSLPFFFSCFMNPIFKSLFLKSILKARTLHIFLMLLRKNFPKNMVLKVRSLEFVNYTNKILMT